MSSFDSQESEGESYSSIDSQAEISETALFNAWMSKTPQFETSTNESLQEVVITDKESSDCIKNRVQEHQIEISSSLLSETISLPTVSKKQINGTRSHNTSSPCSEKASNCSSDDDELWGKSLRRASTLATKKDGVVDLADSEDDSKSLGFKKKMSKPTLKLMTSKQTRSNKEDCLSFGFAGSIAPTIAETVGRGIRNIWQLQGSRVYSPSSKVDSFIINPYGSRLMAHLGLKRNDSYFRGNVSSEDQTICHVVDTLYRDHCKPYRDAFISGSYSTVSNELRQKECTTLPDAISQIKRLIFTFVCYSVAADVIDAKSFGASTTNHQLELQAGPKSLFEDLRETFPRTVHRQTENHRNKIRGYIADRVRRKTNHWVARLYSDFDGISEDATTISKHLKEVTDFLFLLAGYVEKSCIKACEIKSMAEYHPATHDHVFAKFLLVELVK